MRRIVMFNRVTPEGYFASAEGGLDWAVPDDAIDRLAVDGTASVDLMLFGRRTYDMFASFWPGALAAPDTEDPHRPGRRPPAMHALAVWINQTAKLVFSRTLREVTWQGARIAPALDPAAIRALKQAPGKDIIVFGSGSIVTQLTEHALIDEYRFLVNPILLGSGLPLLGARPGRLALALLDATAYGSGNVMLRYAPQRA